MTRAEMDRLGWDALDVLLVSGDAYVDHPAFGVALLGRWLAAHGFRVGIAAQPPWKERERALDALTAMGRPRLFTGVTAGALDSMLAHYTAFRKKRHDDAYTPGGKAGARPDRACIVYTGLVRQAFPGMPVILGGIEASLRRASHYDFWTDALRRPLLQDSKADILVCGMGEAAILAIARAAQDLAGQGAPPERQALRRACARIPGLALPVEREHVPPRRSRDALFLPSHEEILADSRHLLLATLAMEQHAHNGTDGVLQRSGDSAVRFTPFAPPLSTRDLDRLHALPFSRLPHPDYQETIPAWEMIRTSITTHRGCGGGCSFCSLALHQGRRIASRSAASILDEARTIAQGPGRTKQGAKPAAPPKWAGSISDVGGPSANMWQARCARPEGKSYDRPCIRQSCLHPTICPFFKVNQAEGVALLRAMAGLPGIRHVRVASGVRFDLALADREALYAYTCEFTGGQLKAAPEHIVPHVLRLMRKPDPAVFERFLEAFSADSRSAGKEQYIVPYLMSAFPGCTLDDMRRLRSWLKARNWSPRQVQCFIPTPGSVATAMFYSKTAPDGSPLHVVATDRERLVQHHMLTDGPRSATLPPDGAPRPPYRRSPGMPPAKRKTPAAQQKSGPARSGPLARKGR